SRGSAAGSRQRLRNVYAQKRPWLYYRHHMGGQSERRLCCSGRAPVLRCLAWLDFLYSQELRGQSCSQQSGRFTLLYIAVFVLGRVYQTQRTADPEPDSILQLLATSIFMRTN